MNSWNKCPVCGYESIDQSLSEKIKTIKISVIIPAYNEESTIRTIIDRVRKVPINKEIIVIDDGSTDATRDVIQEYAESHPEIRAFYHDINRGKGSALRTGFAHATGDIFIVQDADLEYDPSDYFRLLRPILDGRADVVYGSRFIGETHRVLFFWHYVANKILTTISNMFTNLNLTDIETGYKVFKREAISDITIVSKRFGFEPEITAKIAKKGLRIYETPISYSGRDYSQGKKIGWKDAVAAFWHILRFNLFS